MIPMKWLPDVDELESSNESDLGGRLRDGSSARQAILREKQLARRAQDEAKLALSVKNQQAAKARRSKEVEVKRVDDDLIELDGREEMTLREFRRHALVQRIRPLGKDRFHCQYWFMDGVGSMDLVGSGGVAIYGTGRLFIQGPTEDDWKSMCDEYGGAATVVYRRWHEEGGIECSLEPGQWAIISEEEEVRPDDAAAAVSMSLTWVTA